jgi:hypothetical protein
MGAFALLVALTRSCNTALRKQPNESATTVAEIRWSGCRMSILCSSSTMHCPDEENAPMMCTYEPGVQSVSYQAWRRVIALNSLVFSSSTNKT